MVREPLLTTVAIARLRHGPSRGTHEGCPYGTNKTKPRLENKILFPPRAVTRDSLTLVVRD